MSRNRNNDNPKGRHLLLSKGSQSNFRDRFGSFDSVWEEMSFEWGNETTDFFRKNFANVDKEIISDVLNQCKGDVEKTTDKLNEMIGVSHPRKKSEETDLATIACSLLSYEAYGAHHHALAEDSGSSETMKNSDFFEGLIPTEANFFANQITMSSIDCTEDHSRSFDLIKSHSLQHWGASSLWTLSNSELNSVRNMDSNSSFASYATPFSISSPSISTSVSDNCPQILFPECKKLDNALPNVLQPSFPVGYLETVDVSKGGPKTSEKKSLDATHCSKDSKFKSANYVVNDTAVRDPNINITPKKTRRRKSKNKIKNLVMAEKVSDENVNLSDPKLAATISSTARGNSFLKDNLTPNVTDMNEYFSGQFQDADVVSKLTPVSTDIPSHALFSSQELQRKASYFNHLSQSNSHNSSHLQNEDSQLSAHNIYSKISNQARKTALKEQSSPKHIAKSDQCQENNPALFQNYDPQVVFDPVDPLGWNDIFPNQLTPELKPIIKLKKKGHTADKKEQNMQSKSLPPWAETNLKPHSIKKLQATRQVSSPNKFALDATAIKQPTEKSTNMDERVLLEGEIHYIDEHQSAESNSWNGGDVLQPNNYLSKAKSSPVASPTNIPGLRKSRQAANVNEMVLKSDAPVNSTDCSKKPINVHDLSSPVNVIRHYISEQRPVLVILRGLPGSGKTYLAKQLIIEGTKLGAQGIILSTDDYFLQKGVYNFNKNDLGLAHDWNKKRAFSHVMNNVSPIIIDNTNLSLWEFLPYAEIALSHAYDIQIFEPDTAWKFKVAELSRKNSHGVAKEHIKRMKERYEPVSTETLIKAARATLKNKAVTPASTISSISEDQKPIPTFQPLVEKVKMKQHANHPAQPQNVLSFHHNGVTASRRYGVLPSQHQSSSTSLPPWHSPQNKLHLVTMADYPKSTDPKEDTKPDSGGHEKISRQEVSSYDETVLAWCEPESQRAAKPKNKSENVKKSERQSDKITQEYLNQSLQQVFASMSLSPSTPQSDTSSLFSGFFEDNCSEKTSNVKEKLQNVKQMIQEDVKVIKGNFEISLDQLTTGQASKKSYKTDENQDVETAIDSIDDFHLDTDPQSLDELEKSSVCDSSFSTVEAYRTCCSNEGMIAAKIGELNIASTTSIGQLQEEGRKRQDVTGLAVDTVRDLHLQDIVNTPRTPVDVQELNYNEQDVEAGAAPGSLKLVTSVSSFDSDSSNVTSSQSSASLSLDVSPNTGPTKPSNPVEAQSVASVQKLYLTSPLVSYSDSETDDKDVGPDVLLEAPSRRIHQKVLAVDNSEEENFTENTSYSVTSSRVETPQIQENSSQTSSKKKKKRHVKKGRTTEPFIATDLKEKSKSENWSNFYKLHTVQLSQPESVALSCEPADASALLLWETKSSYVQCEPYMFSVLYKLNSNAFNKLQPVDMSLSDVVVITASSRSIQEAKHGTSAAVLPRKSGRADRSTNTDETSEKEEIDLETLHSCFPEYSMHYLEEVMAIYHNDIEWVTSYLLDAPAYSDLVEDDKSEEEQQGKKPTLQRLKSLAEMCSSIARSINLMDQDDLEMKVIQAGEDRLQKIETFGRSRLLSNDWGQYYDSWEDRLVLEDFTGSSPSAVNSWKASSSLQYKAEPPNYNGTGLYGRPTQDNSDLISIINIEADIMNSQPGDTMPSVVSSQTELFSIPVVPISLIKSLEYLYGPLNLKLSNEGYILNYLTARKIYNCLKLQSVEKVVSSKTEKQLKEDEALARALQEKEDSLSKIKTVTNGNSSVLGWSDQTPSWMHQAVHLTNENTQKKLLGNQTPNLSRTGSVADTLHLLRGTEGKRMRPFKFQKKLPKHAVKSVWTGVKKKNQADSFLSIMEEEKAREEIQKEQMRLIELTGDTQALATRIKRTELAQMYPSLGPGFLEEVFMSSGYSLEKTVKTLEVIYGISPAPMSKERQNEIIEQFNKRNEDNKRQFESADDDDQYYDDSWSYEDLRQEAEVYHNLARECKEQANRYLGDGMPSAALFYRQKAKNYKEREYTTNHKAAEILFEKGKERLSRENTLDLHFYHLDEAMLAVNKAIKMKEEEYRLKIDKKNNYLNIVTGRGRNSKDGIPILKPAVINYLRDSCYRFEEKSPGMLKVYINQRI